MLLADIICAGIKAVLTVGTRAARCNDSSVLVQMTDDTSLLVHQPRGCYCLHGVQQYAIAQEGFQGRRLGVFFS